MKLNAALSGVVLMRAMFMLHLLSWKIPGALHDRSAAEDALKGLSQSNPTTTALLLASFHFSYLSDHTERGNCMGKSLDV